MITKLMLAVENQTWKPKSLQVSERKTVLKTYENIVNKKGPKLTNELEQNIESFSELNKKCRKLK
jgi:hypothetical protein